MTNTDLVPVDLDDEVMRLWGRKLNTKEIADELSRPNAKVPESLVASALRRGLERRRTCAQ